MAVFKDLVGTRFTRLVVQERVWVASKTPHWEWKCSCDCGSICVVSTGCLNNGGTKSCGCLNKEAAQSRSLARVPDLTGQRFGKLLVKGLSKEIGKYRARYWDCLCDCGNIRVCVTGALTSQPGVKLPSCGKCGASTTPFMHTKSLVGAVFGKLTVQSPIRVVYKNKKCLGTLWKCLCACGQEFECLTSDLDTGSGNSRSCGCARFARFILYRESLGLPGNIPITPENMQERGKFGRELRKYVLERDDFTCMLCGVRGNKLNVHHILGWRKHPDLRFVESNLVTLCVACHLGKVHLGNSRTNPCAALTAVLAAQVAALYKKEVA